MFLHPGNHVPQGLAAVADAALLIHGQFGGGHAGDEENDDEKGDLQPPGPAQGLNGNGPGEDVNGLYIEDKEKGGDQVKRNRISKQPRAGGNDPALKRGRLLRLLPLFPEPIGQE